MKALGWILTVGGALGNALLLVVWLFPSLHAQSVIFLLLGTFLPWWWVLVGAVLVGLALLTKHKILLVLLVAVLVVAGWGAWPSPRQQGAQAGPSVLMLNTYYGHADPVALTREMKQVDVAVLVEYTPLLDEGLQRAGAFEDMPYRVGSVREDAGGTIILSRFPLTELGRTKGREFDELGQINGTAFDNVLASLTYGGEEWKILGVHQSPPHYTAAQWAFDAERIIDLAKPHLGDKLVVTGDFNAIEQHFTMLRMADEGFIDAQSGRGWAPTWPVTAGSPWFARIDHVLHSPSVKMDRPEVVVVLGTDHAGLKVTPHK